MYISHYYKILFQAKTLLMDPLEVTQPGSWEGLDFYLAGLHDVSLLLNNYCFLRRFSKI